MMRMDATRVQGWAWHLDQLIEWIGGCFARHDLRRRASFVRGLLGPVQRKNGWQLAEHVRDATPHAVQRLAMLAVVRAQAGTPSPQKGADDLVPLTEPEGRRLLIAMVWPRLNDDEQALA